MKEILINEFKCAISSLPKRAWLWYINNWQDVLVWVWTVAVLSADLKVSIYPHIHWLATVMLLVPVFLVMRRRDPGITNIKAPIVPSVLLVIAVIISSFNSLHFFYGLVQSGKLIAILIWAYSFFIIWPKYAHIAFKGFIAAAYLNAVLLIFGIFLLPSAAHQMAIGRWGTILNYPGSLDKVGLLIFTYAAYMVIAAKPFSFKHDLLLCFSSLIIYFDGSRTGSLALLGGILFTLFICFLKCKTWDVLKHTLQRVAYLFISLAVFWAIILFSIQIINHTNTSLTQIPGQEQKSPTSVEEKFIQPPQGFDRINETVADTTNEEVGTTNEEVGTTKDGIFQKLAARDPARFKMLQDGLAAVMAHPVFGTGIGSTKSETNVGPMVIHNTYLQVWADLGLLGLIAFIILVLGWIPFLPEAYRRIQELPNPENRAVYYTAIFMLCYFAYNGLFHPLSTEWSEWVTFIIPYALYWEVSHRKLGLKIGGPAE
jgi:hypothetical protein